VQSLVELPLFQRCYPNHRRLRGFLPLYGSRQDLYILYVFVGISLLLGFLNTIAERSTEGRRGILGRRRPEESEPNHDDERRRDKERD
jgi:hypothetical protein